MDIQKNNVFKQIILSILSIKDYPGFVREKSGKVFLYSTLLIVITYIVTFVVPASGFLALLFGIDQAAVDERVPYFELSNGRFYIAETVEHIDETGMMLFFATSEIPVSMEQAREALRDYFQGIIITRDSMMIKNMNQIQEFDFASMQGASITRDNLYNMIPMIKFAVIFIYILMAAVYIGVYCFAWLVCSVIGMLVNVFIKAPAGFNEIFKLTAYARTAPILVKMLFFLMPFSFALHFTFFYLIFIFYMVMALLAMRKNENINGVK
jgi:hypothetical protein